jgi:hypothetical protein
MKIRMACLHVLRTNSTTITDLTFTIPELSQLWFKNLIMITRS